MINIEKFLYQLEPGDKLACSGGTAKGDEHFRLYTVNQPVPGHPRMELHREVDNGETIPKKDIKGSSWIRVIVFQGGHPNLYYKFVKNIKLWGLYAIDERHPEFKKVQEQMQLNSFWLFDKHGELKDEFPEMEGIL